jgi:hypothetical protein
VKFKLEAGMDLDLLTRDEVRRELQGWQAELVRGITFRTLSLRGDQSGGTYTLTTQKDGPAAGMVWSLTRVAVAGNAIVLGTDSFSVGYDDTSFGHVIATGVLRQKEWNPGGVVVPGPRSIVVYGAATGGTGTDVFASLSVIEVPMQLAWQLI